MPLTSFLVSDVNKHSVLPLPLSLAAPTEITAASLWLVCVAATAIRRAALINKSAFCSSLLYKDSCVSSEAPPKWLSAKFSSDVIETVTFPTCKKNSQDEKGALIKK